MCASQLQKCWYNQTNVLKGLVRCFPLSPSVLKRKEKKSHQNKLKCLGKDSAYSMSVHSCKLGAAFGLQFCKVFGASETPRACEVNVDMLRKDGYPSCAYFPVPNSLMVSVDVKYHVYLPAHIFIQMLSCLLYTSDAADER